MVLLACERISMLLSGELTELDLGPPGCHTRVHLMYSGSNRYIQYYGGTKKLGCAQIMENRTCTLNRDVVVFCRQHIWQEIASLMTSSSKTESSVKICLTGSSDSCRIFASGWNYGWRPAVIYAVKEKFYGIEPSGFNLSIPLFFKTKLFAKNKTSRLNFRM